MHIIVTLELVSDVLCVPRVEHPDYPECESLRTVSKDEMISTFCKRPFDWGDRQFTPCKAFAKGPRFMNTVMNFVLQLLPPVRLHLDLLHPHPLPHLL